MKKITLLFVGILLSNMLLFLGCNKTTSFLSYNSKEYVHLCDYRNLSIPDGYADISEDNIRSIINVELSVNNAYVEVTEKDTPEANDIVLIVINGHKQYYFVNDTTSLSPLDHFLLTMQVGQTSIYKESKTETVTITLLGIYRLATSEDDDFVLDFYGVKDKAALESFIRERAADEIIFNYLLETIMEQSIISDVPAEIYKQIVADLNSYQKKILQQYESLDAFLLANEITYDDLYNSVASYYYEIMLFKAILDDAELTIQADEINSKKMENNGEEISFYDAYKILAEAKVRDYLISLYR